MIVSHRHGFIFLKTRKTAGTSIEIALSRHCGPRDIITPITPEDEALRLSLGIRGPQNCAAGGRTLNNHAPAALVREAVGAAAWRNYFKFTIERNPFDKAISRYWWSTRDMRPRPPIGAFLRAAPAWMLSDWPIYTIDDAVCVDRVMRYETLDEELAGVSEMLGIGPLELVQAKSGYREDRRPYRDVLSPADRALIEGVCRRELDAFGYSW